MGGEASHSYMARSQIQTGEYYHVFNRGVDKRLIFHDDKDRHRFVHDLYEFNDRDAAVNLYRTVGGFASHKLEKKKRKLLVDIVAWVFMPNHYHLLLRQRTDNGISAFMHKLGTGYTLYFNNRHERSGVLFQGTFKAIHIHEDRYIRQLLGYLHANPSELFQSNIRNSFQRYRWSSYFDYCGKKNIPSLLNEKLIIDLGLPRGAAHGQFIEDWLDRRAPRLSVLGDLAID